MFLASHEAPKVNIGMKRIMATPPGSGRSPRIEEFLIPESIPDAQGQEHPVAELMDQCRRNYQSHSLLKKTARMRAYTAEERAWIVANRPEVVQYRLGITREQAVNLRYRIIGEQRRLAQADADTK